MAEEGLEVETPKGVKLNIPPLALADDKGEVVTGPVEVHFRDFRDRLDQVFADFSLDFERDGRWFLYNSAGMFEIRALSGKDTLQVVAGRNFKVEYPYNDSIPDLKFYKFNGISGNWETLAEVNPQEPGQPVIELPEGVEAAKGTDPAESNPTSRSNTRQAAAEEPLEPPDPSLPVSDSIDIDSTRIPGSSSSEDAETLKVEFPDTLNNQPQFECPECEKACIGIWYGFNLFSAMELVGPNAHSIDLRYFYIAYSQPENVEDYFCRSFLLNLRPASGLRKRRRYLRIQPNLKFPGLPKIQDWNLQVLSSRKKFLKATRDPLLDLSITRKRSSQKLILKTGSDTKLKVKFRGASRSRSAQKAELDHEWNAFQAAAASGSSILDTNLARFRLEVDCLLKDSTAPQAPRQFMSWLRSRKGGLNEAFNFYFYQCLELDTTCFCPPDPIIWWDTLRIDSGGLAGKQLIYSNLGTPVVILNEFGIYNFDAISELPDPRWVQAQYLKKEGGFVNPYRAFLLVGEINGVIGLPDPYFFKVSPSVRNMILAVGLRGPVYYCPAALFPKVPETGLPPIQIPLIKVPWKPGDDPVDLREALPFK